MSAECLFCKITAGEIDSDRVAETDDIVAFRDIAPRAPVHVLVVPRLHLASAHELAAEHADLLAGCFRMAQQVAESEGTADGYRITTNIGAKGGQEIPHLHFHVLGGRQLGHIDSAG